MEDVKSNTSMDKLGNKGFGGSANAKNTAEKSSLVEGEKEEEADKGKEKKRAPSICSCEYEFHHSKNLHQYTSMQRQK